MSIWFTSDYHLGHKRIISLTDRPFNTVDEMNESIIDTHNIVVKPGDTVYMLGDMVMGGWQQNIPLIGKMNGRKILVTGNHDQPFIHRDKSSFERIMKGYGEYFDEIHLDHCRFGRFVLSHFPYDADHTDDPRYMEYRPVDKGYTLMCGHLHLNEFDAPVFRSKLGTLQIHVGVDQWKRPVSRDEIELLIS